MNKCVAFLANFISFLHILHLNSYLPTISKLSPNEYFFTFFMFKMQTCSSVGLFFCILIILKKAESDKKEFNEYIQIKSNEKKKNMYLKL